MFFIVSGSPQRFTFAFGFFLRSGLQICFSLSLGLLVLQLANLVVLFRDVADSPWLTLVVALAGVSSDNTVFYWPIYF